MDDSWREYANSERWSTTQAAACLGCSHDSVLRMIGDGTLYGWKPNKRKYVLYRKQVEQMAARQQAEAIHKARVLQASFEVELFM